MLPSRRKEDHMIIIVTVQKCDFKSAIAFPVNCPNTLIVTKTHVNLKGAFRTGKESPRTSTLLLPMWFALLLLFSTDSLLTAPLLFNACLNLGTIHRLLKELSKAEQLYSKALEIAMSVKDSDKEIIAKIHLAICLLDRGELKEAISSYFEPLMGFKTAMKKDTRSLYLRYYGGACRSAADWGRAKDYLREALDFANEMKDSGLVSSCCGELGNVFRSEGR